MASTFEQAAAEQRSRRFRNASFEAYKNWPHFTHRTQRGRVHWMVLYPNWMDHRLNGDVTDDLNKIIRAEGWEDSLELAWSCATQAAGTDQLYLSGGHAIRDLVSTRAEQRRQERWAAKESAGEDAASIRYVFSYDPSDYFQGQDPYPYRRWRILKETRQFLFVEADRFGEPINAQGEPMQAEPVGRYGRSSSFRVPKARFSEATEYSPIGAADMGSGWHTVAVWMSLKGLVDHVASRLPQYGDNRRIPPTDKSWREVLGLPSDEHLEPHQVKRAYRRALMVAHPDHGGSRLQLEAVMRAFEIGRQLVEVG